jgi:hypothetical protein
MTSACKEARRAAIEFYDRMAATSRPPQAPVQRVPPAPARYHDRPWASNSNEPKALAVPSRDPALRSMRRRDEKSAPAGSVDLAHPALHPLLQKLGSA